MMIVDDSIQTIESPNTTINQLNKVNFQDSSRMKLMQEKLSRFAEKLCVKERLKKALFDLYEAESITQRIKSRDYFREDDTQYIMQFQDWQSLGTHWSVMRRIEEVSFRIKDSLKSHMLNEREILSLEQKLSPDFFKKLQGEMIPSQNTQDFNYSDKIRSSTMNSEKQNIYNPSYQLDLKHYEEEIECLKREREDIEKAMINYEQEEKWLKDQLQKYQQDLEIKNKELIQFKEIKKQKKELESLVIKASNEIKLKEEESSEKSKALNKAQQIIERLTQESEVMHNKFDEDFLKEQSKNQKEMHKWKEIYEGLITDYQKLEKMIQKKDIQMVQITKEYEEQIKIIQKQADDVIYYLKQENMKNKVEDDEQSIYFGNQPQVSNRSIIKRSKSQSRTNLQSISPNRIQRPILQTNTPNNRNKNPEQKESLNNNGNHFKTISSAKKSVKFQDDVFEDKRVQIALDELEQTFLVIHHMRDKIKSLVENEEIKLMKLTRQTKDYIDDFNQKIEKCLMKEQILNKEVQKRDIALKETLDNNKKLKQALLEFQSYHQSVQDQYHQQLQLICSVQDQQKQEYEMQVQGLQQIQGQLEQQLIQKFDHIKELEVVINQQELNYDMLNSNFTQQIEKSQQLEEEVDKLFAQVDDEIQQRSNLNYQLDQLQEQIKEVWLNNECSQDFYSSLESEMTLRIHYPSFQEMLEQVAYLLNRQKLQNDQQKEEGLQILSQMRTIDNTFDQQRIGNQINTSTFLKQKTEVKLKPKRLSYGSEIDQSINIQNSQLDFQGNQMPKNSGIYQVLKEEINKIKTDLSHKNEQIQQLQVKLKDKLDEIEHLKQEKTVINVQCEGQKQNIQELKDQLGEKVQEVQDLKIHLQRFQQDYQPLQLQLESIMNQNTELIYSKQEWQKAYKELENDLIQVHKEKDQFTILQKEKELRYLGKIRKFKDKLQRKEQLLFDLRVHFEEEMKQRQATIEEFETQRKGMCVSRYIQTDNDDNQSNDFEQEIENLEEENNCLKQELDQVKHDINLVLQQLDKQKYEQQVQSENAIYLEQEIARLKLKNEKYEIQRELLDERDLVEQQRQFEYQQNQLIMQRDDSFPAFLTNNEFLIDNNARRNGPINQSEKQNFNNIAHNFKQFNDQEICKIKRSSSKSNQKKVQSVQQSQAQLLTYDNQNYKSHQQLFQPQIMNNKIYQTTQHTPSQQEPVQQQQSMRNSICSQGNRIKGMVSTINHTSRNNMAEVTPIGKQTHQTNQFGSLPYQMDTSNYDTYYIASSCPDRNNIDISDNQTQPTTNPTNTGRNGDIKLLMKRKLKKRLRHFESILVYLTNQIQGKDFETQRPPLLTRKNSQSRQNSTSGLLGQKNQGNDEVLFYQAQSFFYYKHPQVYNLIQALMQSSIKQINEKQDQMRWQYLQMTRKLTALCLDGAILNKSSSKKFSDEIDQAKEFLQLDTRSIFQQENQINKINDQMLEGLSQIVNNACEIVIKGGSINSSQSHSRKDIDQLDLSIIVPQNEVLQSLGSICYKFKELNNTITQLNDILISKFAKNNLIKEESFTFIIQGIKRFTQSLKQNFGKEYQGLEQFAKQMNIRLNQFNDDHIQHDFQDILESFQEIDIECIKNKRISIKRSNNKQSKIDINKEALSILKFYDQEFSHINEKQINSFIERLIVKIRKEVDQKENILKVVQAIKEVDCNLENYSIENCKSSNEISEMSLLLILKEYLEIRQVITIQ